MVMNPIAVAWASDIKPNKGVAPSYPSRRQKYSADTMETAPYAAGRMISSSAHPNRNAGARPKLSRMYTYTPPVRGYIAESSAKVNAPASAITAPSTQPPTNRGTEGTRDATTAGVRKIPEPMVEPATTAIALTKPSLRGSRSPQRSGAGRPGSGMA